MSAARAAAGAATDRLGVPLSRVVWAAAANQSLPHCPRFVGLPAATSSSAAATASTAQAGPGILRRPLASIRSAHAKTSQAVCTSASSPSSSAAAKEQPTDSPPSPVSISSGFHDWEGLAAWRAIVIDRRRVWGEKGPGEPPGCSEETASPADSNLAQCGLEVLHTADPHEKIRLTHRAWAAFARGGITVGSVPAADMPLRPARPDRPELVNPRKIPSPKNSPLPLNVYMLHNLAHIELNAIDLAWDTVARFSELSLPVAFYMDFAHVADDESRHLGWCLQRLEELGYSYGDMAAHDLLWEGAQLSSEDVSWRMCMIPMSQEARGLDAGPRLVQKMVGWGDNRSAAIVDRISLEEKAHVAIGVSWFSRICAALQQQPEQQFRSTMSRLCPELLSGIFNHEARGEVGLPQSWYDLSAYPEEEAHRIAAAAGLVLGKPGKRVDPTGPPLLPPDKLGAEHLKLLQSRLASMVDMEVANATR